MTKPKSKQTRRPAGTLNALSKALKLTKRQVSTLLLQGMPDTVAEAVAWRQAEHSSDSAEQLRRERILLIREQRQRVEIENKRVSGELIPRAAVKLSDTKIGCAVRAFSKAVENELPALCLGLGLERSRPLVRTRMSELQELLADEFSAFWQDYPATDSK
jgi:hypothetical protein